MVVTNPIGDEISLHVCTTSIFRLKKEKRENFLYETVLNSFDMLIPKYILLIIDHKKHNY